MFVYYIRQPWAAKILKPYGPRFAPVIFMSIHVMFFIVSCVFAIIAYNSYYIHTLMMFSWFTVSVWNGANFYMEYFSRKYESNLKMLE